MGGWDGVVGRLNIYLQHPRMSLSQPPPLRGGTPVYPLVYAVLGGPGAG